MDTAHKTASRPEAKGSWHTKAEEGATQAGSRNFKRAGPSSSSGKLLSKLTTTTTNSS